MISSITNQPGSGVDLDALDLTQPAEATEQTLGQEQFLELMITQLENQDPFKPLESGEFLGQLAQFGTVSGLAELKSSFADLASALVSNQALQAAQLVGRSVLVASSDAQLEEGADLEGAVELPNASSSVRVQIRDASGQLVRELDLGASPGGVAKFQWDGTTDGGEPAEPGRYGVTAHYFDGGEIRSAATLIHAAVESVRLGQRGLAVQLRGLGEVPFSSVQEIG
jgi:flagellar basal-body rod modification protein FlgD